MTQTTGMELIRRVEHIERKSGLFRVEKHREHGNRDKGREGKHHPQKGSEHSESNSRIDITV
jgi:hypothetical protein